MKTRFPIKVKEIVIDAEEYDKIVNELEESRAKMLMTEEMYNKIPVFFQRLKNYGVSINNNANDPFDPSNVIHISNDKMIDGITITIMPKK